MRRKSRIMLAVVAYVMFLKFFEKPITYFFSTLKDIFNRARQNAQTHICIRRFIPIILEQKQQPNIGLRCGYITQFLLI